VDPPGNAWPDSRIYVELARRLGKEAFFPYTEPREILDELREASRGGPADYAGITYEKLDREFGVFWPCPSEEHPGTPRLFEGGRFFHPDGKARFVLAENRPSGDPVDEEFPVYLTTGRVVSQYLSGTQTRRIGALVDQYPEPRVEIHPRLAEEHGVGDGDWVTVTTRRGELAFRAMVVRTIRPDTVFVPYHWPGRRSVNLLTHRTLDPRSKIPEYKVSACRLRRAEGPPEWAREPEPAAAGERGRGARFPIAGQG
jgi:assimilatory nitrate reductase catalytic subunit